MLALELAEQERQHDRSGSRRGADRELTAERPARLGSDLVEELLLERQQALGAAVQAPTRLRRLDPSSGAVEQLRAEPLLERSHLQRDGGLRDTQPLGGLREAAALDDRAERGELTGVHKRMLSHDPSLEATYTTLYYTNSYM